MHRAERSWLGELASCGGVSCRVLGVEGGVGGREGEGSGERVEGRWTEGGRVERVEGKRRVERGSGGGVKGVS